MPAGPRRARGRRPGAAPAGTLEGGRRGDKGADLHAVYTPVRSRLRPLTAQQPSRAPAALGSDEARPCVRGPPLHPRPLVPCINGAPCLVFGAALPSGTDVARLQRSGLPPQLQKLLISGRFVHSSLPSRSGTLINDKLVLKIATIVVTKPALFHHHSHFCLIYYASQNNSEHCSLALSEGW